MITPGADRSAFDRVGLAGAFLFYAEVSPRRPALTIGARVWSYAEASETARRWAATLTKAVGGRPGRVAILGSRSETAYLGTLTALFAGAAFVPLNHKYPVARTRLMIEQAEIDAMFVGAECLAYCLQLLPLLENPPAIIVPSLDRNVIPDAASELVVFGRQELASAILVSDMPRVLPTDLAYLLFTSGSTGTPKGVAITHDNIRAFLDSNLDRYGFGPDDRFSQISDQTFDLSVFDMFMAWECGAGVHSMSPMEILAPIKFLRDNAITVSLSVPSLAALVLKRGEVRTGSLPALKWCLFCGEALPRVTAEAWQTMAPDAALENLYGPTELTIACAAYRWKSETSPPQCFNDLVPIGEVYAGLAALIVDDALVEVEPGQPGELCIAGRQLSPGYWQAPALTAAATFERTAGDGLRRLYYRTGDVVAERDGGMVFLGRKDQQVKIRGYRIELEEIEAVLRRAGCEQAAALVWKDAIAAFVCYAGDMGSLKAYLAEQLPHIMIPQKIIFLPVMPVNANGKLDRHALQMRLSAESGHS